jgi:hypothetical protein
MTLSSWCMSPSSSEGYKLYMVKDPTLGLQRLEEHVYRQTHSHLVSHGEVSPWVEGRRFSDAVCILKYRQHFLPVGLDDQRGLSQHCIQVCLPDACDVQVVPSWVGVFPFNVTIPTQLALKRDTEVRSLHPLHHLYCLSSSLCHGFQASSTMTGIGNLIAPWYVYYAACHALQQRGKPFWEMEKFLQNIPSISFTCLKHPPQFPTHLH